MLFPGIFHFSNLVVESLEFPGLLFQQEVLSVILHRHFVKLSVHPEELGVVDSEACFRSPYAHSYGIAVISGTNKKSYILFIS